MKFRPLHDRVLLRRIEQEAKTAGGIIIPDTAKEKPMQGTVIEIGPGRTNEDGTKTPLEVKKGDKILYGKYSGTEVSIGNDEYLIMRESDIFAIIKES